MTTTREWRRTLWLISLWEPPTSQIRFFPMMDDCGMGMIHVRLELGESARVVYVPHLKYMPFIHSLLSECAMALMMEADWQPSTLDLASQAFEAKVAEMGGSNGTR